MRATQVDLVDVCANFKKKIFSSDFQKNVFLSSQVGSFVRNDVLSLFFRTCKSNSHRLLCDSEKLKFCFVTFLAVECIRKS